MKYQKKVSDITDEDRAKRLIEQKKKYIEAYKEKVKQHRLENNIIDIRPGRKNKTDTNETLSAIPINPPRRGRIGRPSKNDDIN